MSQNRPCYICLKPNQTSPVLPDMPVYIFVECAKQHGASVTWEDVDNKSAAPWTEDQSASLAAYQHSSTFIPFVCDDQHLMTVKQDGLCCETCDTLQIWTYNWTLDWSWKNLEPPTGSGRPVKNPMPQPTKSDEIALELPSSEKKDAS